MLYSGGGAGLTEVLDEALPPDEWQKLRKATARLLVARGDPEAATLLNKFPFVLHHGTNYFADEFCVLYVRLPLDLYVELSEAKAESATAGSFRNIAGVLSEIGPFTRFIAASLDTEDSVIPVSPPSPKITSEAVERALADAEKLIDGRGASSAVDRVHTALHGYLKAALQRRKIEVPFDSSIMNLLRLLRESEPSLRDLGNRGDEVSKVLKALSTIVDCLNTFRNLASGAHPADQVLDDPEAMLAINATRTLLHYLDQKLNAGG
jgi:hypothetical protein